MIVTSWKPAKAVLLIDGVISAEQPIEVGRPLLRKTVVLRHSVSFPIGGNGQQAASGEIWDEKDMPIGTLPTRLVCPGDVYRMKAWNE